MSFKFSKFQTYDRSITLTSTLVLLDTTLCSIDFSDRNVLIFDTPLTITLRPFKVSDPYLILKREHLIRVDYYFTLD